MNHWANAYAVAISDIAEGVPHVGPRGIDGLHQPCDRRLTTHACRDNFVEVECTFLKRVGAREFL